MSSNDATPCSSRKIASSRSACRIRLATKPGISLCSTTGCLPSRRASSSTVSKVSSEVAGERTTSTQAITSAGLKKCMLATRSGRPVASAICDETMVEELVARIACGGAALSSRAKISRLTSRLLHRGLDDEVGRGRGRVQVGAEGQPVEGGVHIGDGSPALLDVAVQPGRSWSARGRSASDEMSVTVAS